MKKLSIILVALLSTATLVSCTSGDEVSSTPSAQSTIAELSIPEPEPEPEPEPAPLPTLGDAIAFDGFEVVLGDDLGDFKTVENKYSDFFGTDTVTLPMTVTNFSGGKKLFNPLFVKIFAPDGVQSRYLGVLFGKDDIFSVGETMDGGKVHTNFHFEYRGDGDYHLEMTSATDYITVVIPVKK